MEATARSLRRQLPDAPESMSIQRLDRILVSMPLDKRAAVVTAQAKMATAKERFTEERENLAAAYRRMTLVLAGAAAAEKPAIRAEIEKKKTKLSAFKGMKFPQSAFDANFIDVAREYLPKATMSILVQKTCDRIRASAAALPEIQL